ncbi:MAG: hypothetical protein ACOC8E_09095 [Planctomycetota bacterium]
MPPNDAKHLDPQALTTENAARMLGVSAEMLQADIDAGAPTNADGTINLVHYAAWLNREMRNTNGS